ILVVFVPARDGSRAALTGGGDGVRCGTVRMMRTFSLWIVLVACSRTDARPADPPVPSGPHPRLFVNASNVARFRENAGKAGTAAARVVARCQEAIDHPDGYALRGGADGDNWPAAAMSCAFAYVATNQPNYP